MPTPDAYENCSRRSRALAVRPSARQKMFSSSFIAQRTTNDCLKGEPSSEATKSLEQGSARLPATEFTAEHMLRLSPSQHRAVSARTPYIHLSTDTLRR